MPTRFASSSDARSSDTRSASSLSSDTPSSGSRSTGHIRIFVVDDHPAIHEALRDTVDEVIDMEIDGTAASAQQALRALKRRQSNETDTPPVPDVVVVDISLGDAHGLDLVSTLEERFPALKVIVFSMYDEEVYAERAIRAGASGYLMKSEPTETLVTAVRRVEEGEVYLSRRMASRILGKFATGRSTEPRFAIDQLTDREMQVFRMLGRGRSIREIAEELNLSRKTVETHRRRAKEKLDFDSVSELLQYAVQWTYGQEDTLQEDSLENGSPANGSTSTESTSNSNSPNGEASEEGRVEPQETAAQETAARQ